MDLAALLQQYGYLLLFIGTFVEGESLLLLAGYFAHRGYLDLGGVIATALVAAVGGDQLFFHLGRRHAKDVLARFPRLRDKVNAALLRVERHQVKVVLTMRFLWGLRIALPLALGLTTMDARRFFWLNLLSAAVWSCAFALTGFAASRLVARLVEDLHRYEWWIVGGLAAAGAVVIAWRWLGAQRPRRDAGGRPE